MQLFFFTIFNAIFMLAKKEKNRRYIFLDQRRLQSSSCSFNCNGHEFCLRTNHELYEPYPAMHDIIDVINCRASSERSHRSIRDCMMHKKNADSLLGSYRAQGRNFFSRRTKTVIRELQHESSAQYRPNLPPLER